MPFYLYIKKDSITLKQKLVTTWLAVHTWELHSSSGCTDTDILSCPTLNRFTNGLAVDSRPHCICSKDSSTIAEDCDKLSWWRAEVGLFHTRVDNLVLRLLEMHRIGRLNVSRKGKSPNFGTQNLMRNNLLSHLEESWQNEH